MLHHDLYTIHCILIYYIASFAGSRPIPYLPVNKNVNKEIVLVEYRTVQKSPASYFTSSTNFVINMYLIHFALLSRKNYFRVSNNTFVKIKVLKKI